MPGLDLLPYSAWVAGRFASADFLWDVFFDICTTSITPWGWNHLLKVFPPKKATDPASPKVAAAPADTRPLGLKNSDVKICSTFVAWAVAPLGWLFCDLQRGFIKGRNFVINVPLLDAKAREYSLLPNSMFFMTPIQAFFDFSAAFPSVSRDLIFAALWHYGFSGGILNFLETIFDDVAASFVVADQIFFLCSVQRGIVQGCPLAGLIFSIALDCGFWIFRSRVVDPGLGVVAGCADDIGVVLKSLDSLPL
eukprot:2119069-Karenia_brevis.AAC.1